MSGTELSIYDRLEPGKMLDDLGRAIMMSEMFGVQNASQGKVLALECAARRMPPMSLAERYNIIHGRLSMKADAMLSDFRTKLGGTHKIVANTPDRACVKLILGQEERTFTLTWEELAKEPVPYAGKEADVVKKLTTGKGELTLKPKYATPRSRAQMLWARLISDSIRRFAPEIVAGYYTPEEIGDFTDEGVVIEAEVVDESDTTSENIEAGEPEKTDEPAKKKTRLSGVDNSEYSEPDSSPCGIEMAHELLAMAKRLDIPREKVQSWLDRCGVTSLSQMPVKDAAKLKSALAAKITEAEFPS